MKSKILKVLNDFENIINDLQLIYCNKCKYLKRSYEYSIPLSFVERTNPNDLEDVNHYLELCSDGNGIGKVCSHEICFETINYNTPTEGKRQSRRRINGQGMLNYNNDCKYFKERKDLIYKFLKWIKND